MNNNNLSSILSQSSKLSAKNLENSQPNSKIPPAKTTNIDGTRWQEPEQACWEEELENF
jgi:hypothetical protein